MAGQETIFTFSLQMPMSNVPYPDFWAVAPTSAFYGRVFPLPCVRCPLGRHRNLTIKEAESERCLGASGTRRVRE